jgi:hypothetical protein
MSLSFAPITLESPFGDSDGRLVLRNGNLIAVISRLGPLHGGLAGRWYVEANLQIGALPPEESFANLESLEAWLDGSQ